MENLANRILCAALESSDLTMTALAHTMGMYPSKMANYVHGRSSMRFETLVEIGFAMGFCHFDEDGKLVFEVDLPQKDRKRLIRLAEEHSL